MPREIQPGRFQPSQSQTARPMTSSRSRPLSHGISSVNIVTHCFHEHGMRVMSVPQKVRSGPNASTICCGIFVDVAIGIGLARIARRAGRLDRDIGIFGERQQCRLVAMRGIVLAVADPGVMVDDQLEARMALGDLRRPAADSSTPSARSGSRPSPPPATASPSCRRSSNSPGAAG